MERSDAHAEVELLDYASLWGLDPSVLYLNHGSFGACPRAVLTEQTRLQREMEREPVDFLTISLPAQLQIAREALCSFLGADARDLVFVPNATAGVNAVLRSLEFEPGDELLLTNHTYAACRKTVDFVAAKSGAQIVVAHLPFPVRSDAEIIAAVITCVSPQTRLALLDHVTSPTALILPLHKLVDELRQRDVETLVDGAHAPGMVDVQLSQLGAAYYTGNAHKWLCAPKGGAFLHVRRDRQVALHANVISHGYPSGFQAEFDWTGTFDPTAWLCIAESLRHLGEVVPGGWPQLMRRNRDLVLSARALLLESLEVESPCPDSMIGSMASIPLPPAASGSPAASLDCEGLHHWFRDRGVETWVHPYPMPVLRLSAQLYNNYAQFERLNTLLLEALHGK
jgi:isopenicillin-N epimerase